MPKPNDRTFQLRKKARRFIKQLAVKYAELNAYALPETGGIYLLTLMHQGKEMPLYINFCDNLRMEIGAQQVVQQMLLMQAHFLL